MIRVLAFFARTPNQVAGASMLFKIKLRRRQREQLASLRPTYLNSKMSVITVLTVLCVSKSHLFAKMFRGGGEGFHAQYGNIC